MNCLTPSHEAMPPLGQGHGLAHYGLAPGSLLAVTFESVTRKSAPPPVSRFFSGEPSGLTSCESSGRTDGERAHGGSGEIRIPPPVAPQMGQHGGGGEGPGISTLFRHSSSSAGLLSRLQKASDFLWATATFLVAISGSFLQVVVMPPAESPQWRRKATDFFSTSSFKLKQAGQSAGDNIADAAGKVGSVVKSRWAVFQEARQRRPPGETVQERFITAAATTSVLLRKGISETKEKVAVGKVKVEEAAKKTADKSKTILNNIERWQKGVVSTDVFGVPIEATVQREQSGKAVPLVLVRCADYLVISGLNNEYLFKSEGDRKVLQQLVSLYNEDSGASLPEGVSPIDVGALVKCYLASIPEPLTTFALYDELRDARVSIPDLRNILKKLPNVNYMTLEFVTALLLRVSRKSSLNKMDSCSLAVEFAPLIMWRQGDAGTDLRNHLKLTLKPPPKIVDTTSNTTTWDLLDEDDEDASSQIPLDDASPPDYSSIEVIQCLIEHHNAIFTDANETVWR